MGMKPFILTGMLIGAPAIAGEAPGHGVHQGYSEITAPGSAGGRLALSCATPDAGLTPSPKLFLTTTSRPTEPRAMPKASIRVGGSEFPVDLKLTANRSAKSFDLVWAATAEGEDARYWAMLQKLRKGDSQLVIRETSNGPRETFDFGPQVEALVKAHRTECQHKT